MKPEKQQLRISSKAQEYFVNGYHCAEAVTVAVLEELGEDFKEAAAHATAFGGGFGRTFGETCGALSGALIAIGHLHGRREPGGNWDVPANLGARIRELFQEKHGTTHCGSLRDRFGEERQSVECQKLTGDLAATLLKLITESPAIPTGSSCCCPNEAPESKIKKCS